MTKSGFTYRLDVAPTTTNYQLVYVAGDSGEITNLDMLGLPPGALILLRGRVNQFCSCGMTEWDVRKYTHDYDTREGIAEMFDVDFSPGDIAAAMESCAREYNGLAPYTDTVKPGNLPKNDNSFFDARHSSLAD